MKKHPVSITHSSFNFIFSLPLLLVLLTVRLAWTSTMEQEDTATTSVSIDGSQSNEPALISETGTEMPSRSDTMSLKVLDYKSRFSIGIALPYLYYCENIKVSDVEKSFKEQFGTVPDTFLGAPKSTEYGFAPGLSFNYTKVSKGGLFIQPGITFLLGVNNTYDGSNQGQPIIDQNNDTIGISYKPLKNGKRNIFLDGSFKLGYFNSSYSTAFSFYTGFNANFWNRDFKSTKYVCNYENYFWYSLPFGAEVYVINKPKVILGLKLETMLMLYGQMNAYFHERGNKGNGIDYPSVQLERKAGYHLSLTAGYRLHEHLLVKFIPFVTFYGFGKSNTEQATINSYNSTSGQRTVKFYEPESATLMTGLSIRLDILTSPSDSQ